MFEPPVDEDMPEVDDADPVMSFPDEVDGVMPEVESAPDVSKTNNSNDKSFRFIWSCIPLLLFLDFGLSFRLCCKNTIHLVEGLCLKTHCFVNVLYKQN